MDEKLLLDIAIQCLVTIPSSVSPDVAAKYAFAKADAMMDEIMRRKKKKLERVELELIEQEIEIPF